MKLANKMKYQDFKRKNIDPFLRADDVEDLDKKDAIELRKPKTTDNDMGELMRVGKLSNDAAMSQINSASVVIDDTAREIMNEYLAANKAQYPDMDLPGFIKRLLGCRPVVYLKRWSAMATNLQDGKAHNGPTSNALDAEVEAKEGQWLTADERLLSSLLQVFSASYLINDGNKFNQGITGKRGTHEEFGIISGMIGARFEEKGASEHKLFVTTQDSEVLKEGSAGRIIAEKCGITAFGYDAVKEDFKHNPSHYVVIKVEGKDEYFNVQAYKKWLKNAVRAELTSKNALGKALGKKVYMRASGIGLGVWVLPGQLDVQAQALVDVYAEVLAEGEFSNIGYIDFIWLNANNLKLQAEYKDSKRNTIKAGQSNNNYATSLPEEYKDHLLCFQYAWDSHSFPGNEYGIGMLTASMDPAAASFSNIIVTQNAKINMDNLGAHIFVATPFGMEQVSRGGPTFYNIAKVAERGLRFIEQKQPQQVGTTLTDPTASALHIVSLLVAIGVSTDFYNKWLGRSFLREPMVVGLLTAVSEYSVHGNLKVASLNFIGIASTMAAKGLLELSGTAYAMEIECLCSTLIIGTSLFHILRSKESGNSLMPT